MSLLRQIQDACINPQTDLTTLLRMMRVLAARLQSEDLVRWVSSELGGWASLDSVPEYRKFEAHNLGNFTNGYYHHQSRELPYLPDPEGHFSALEEVIVTQGVAEVQALLNMALSNDTRSVQRPWPAAAVLLWNVTASKKRVLSATYQMSSAWSVITAARLNQILDSIRNRALEFVLEIEALNPDAGEALPGETRIEKEKVSQIFNFTINGGNNNLAAGSTDVTQSLSVQVQSISKGDPESLRHFLLERGVPEEDAAEVTEIVKSEPATPTGLGPRAKAWLATVPGKLASSSWEMTKAVTVELLTAAIKKANGMEG